MTAVQIHIETGATIRQHCLVCDGETEKHAVQAFCYVDGDAVPAGAVCESCLQERDVALRLPVLGDVPTFAALERERAIFNFEEEAYYETGV